MAYPSFFWALNYKKLRMCCTFEPLKVQAYITGTDLVINFIDTDWMTQKKMKWIGIDKQGYKAWVTPDGTIYRFKDLERNDAGKQVEKEYREKIELPNDGEGTKGMADDMLQGDNLYKWELKMQASCAFCPQGEGGAESEAAPENSNSNGTDENSDGTDAIPSWQGYAQGSSTDYGGMYGPTGTGTNGTDASNPGSTDVTYKGGVIPEYARGGDVGYWESFSSGSESGSGSYGGNGTSGTDSTSGQPMHFGGNAPGITDVTYKGDVIPGYVGGSGTGYLDSFSSGDGDETRGGERNKVTIDPLPLVPVVPIVDIVRIPPDKLKECSDTDFDKLYEEFKNKVERAQNVYHWNAPKFQVEDIMGWLTRVTKIDKISKEGQIVGTDNSKPQGMFTTPSDVPLGADRKIAVTQGDLEWAAENISRFKLFILSIGHEYVHAWQLTKLHLPHEERELMAHFFTSAPNDFVQWAKVQYPNDFPTNINFCFPTLNGTPFGEQSYTNFFMEYYNKLSPAQKAKYTDLYEKIKNIRVHLYKSILPKIQEAGQQKKKSSEKKNPVIKNIVPKKNDNFPGGVFRWGL